MIDLNTYIVTFSRSSGSTYYSALTQRSFKTLREARTDVRECLARKESMEKLRHGEGRLNVRFPR
jgi:hypothetical protein